MIKTFENCSPEYQITIVCFFIFLTLLCMILVIYEGTGKRQRKMLLLDSVYKQPFSKWSCPKRCAGTVRTLRCKYHNECLCSLHKRCETKIGSAS